MATGSCEDLDRSEHKHETAHKQLHWEIGAQCGRKRSRECEESAHSKSRDSHPGCTTGGECGPTLKHGRSIDLGASSEHPHPKEQCAERGRSQECRCVLTPEHLPPLPFFQSNPVTPHCTSTDFLHVLSFNMNRGSLPLGRGSMDTETLASSTGMVTLSSAHQPVSSSRQPTNMQQDPAITMSGLTKVQTEEIFLLSHEVQTLRGRLALDFIELSHQEALFCMVVQATRYEKVTWGHPDCTVAYNSLIKSDGEGTSKEKWDEAIECLRTEGGAALLDTNSLLFHHTLEYQNRMIELITRSQEYIQALHKCIWKVVSQVMEKAGKSTADGLGIALHLVDMLPTVPLQLAFNTATAGLFGCTPKVYAVQPIMGTDGPCFSHAPPLGSDQNAMTILSEEILKSTHSIEEKAAQPTWLMTAAGEGTVGVQAVESEGGDYPNHPCMSLSPVRCMSCSPTLHVLSSMGWSAAQYLVPCSSSCSPPRCHLQAIAFKA